MSDKWYSVYGVPFSHHWPAACVCCGKPAETHIKKVLIFSCVDGLTYKEWKTWESKIPLCNSCKNKTFWQKKDHDCFGPRAVKIKEAGAGVNVFFKNHSMGKAFEKVNGILEACPKCGSNKMTYCMPNFQRMNTCSDCNHVWICEEQPCDTILTEETTKETQEEGKECEAQKLLSKALKAEIKGDWDKAILLYEKTIADYSDTSIRKDASIALQALKERMHP